MTPGIYEIKNKLDGMAYGGSSINIEHRWKKHRRMLRNQKHFNPHLQNAWNKYGEDVFGFRVLEVIESAGERLVAEQAWLDEHHAAGTCYNIAITAGPAGPMAEETRRKIGSANRGRKHTEEQNRAKSERMMGKQNAKGNQNRLGAKLSNETKKKIAASIAKPYPAFVHRDMGEVIPAGRNLAQLCRGRGLNYSCMRAVKNGKQPHHKGWAIA